jgi:hypothetical protein
VLSVLSCAASAALLHATLSKIQPKKLSQEIHNISQLKLQPTTHHRWHTHQHHQDTRHLLQVAMCYARCPLSGSACSCHLHSAFCHVPPRPAREPPPTVTNHQSCVKGLPSMLDAAREYGISDDTCACWAEPRTSAAPLRPPLRTPAPAPLRPTPYVRPRPRSRSRAWVG